MRLLALDTTTRAGSVAVVDDDRAIVLRVGDPARSHTERLPGDLLSVLAEAGLPASAIDLFVVASGPGSFTGLRTGIATMQGMALAASKPAIGISALEALAVQAGRGLPQQALIGTWMDAARREVFSALYAVDRAEATGLREVEPASVESPAVVWERWRDLGVLPIAMIGDGAKLHAAQIDPPITVVADEPLAPALAEIARARAARGEAGHPAAVHPVYVRRPDVVLTREAQARK
jgi:tRNA threonylcarbamoyladenosine biosynthesis protein TsaB